jgi:hypothetical protein
MDINDGLTTDEDDDVSELEFTPDENSEWVSDSNC